MKKKKDHLHIRTYAGTMDSIKKIQDAVYDKTGMKLTIVNIVETGIFILGDMKVERILQEVSNLKKSVAKDPQI